MSKSATIHTTIDRQTKAKAQEILESLGMSMSEAVSVYFKQIVLHKGLPFEVKIPNEITLQTFKNTDKGIDLHPSKSVDDLFEEISS